MTDHDPPAAEMAAHPDAGTADPTGHDHDGHGMAGAAEPTDHGHGGHSHGAEANADRRFQLEPAGYAAHELGAHWVDLPGSAAGSLPIAAAGGLITAALSDP